MNSRGLFRRLAARSAGTAPMVRPLLQPLFADPDSEPEPIELTEEVIAPSRSVDASHPRPVAGAPTRTAATVSASEPPLVASAQSLSSAASEAKTIEPAREELRVQEPAEAPASRKPARLETIVFDHAALKTVAQPSSPGASHLRGRQTTKSNAPSAAPPVARSYTERLAAATEALAAGNEAEVPGGTATEAVAPGEASHVYAPELAVAVRSDSVAAESVVRVSIGRVDVRAVLPPSPPVVRGAPKPASPAPSLSEYLERRDKGEW